MVFENFYVDFSFRMASKGKTKVTVISGSHWGNERTKQISELTHGMK